MMFSIVLIWASLGITSNSEYSDLLKVRTNAIQSAIQQQTIVSWANSEESALSAKWRNMCELLPCRSGQSHRCCVPYEIIYQPFNAYFMQVDGIPESQFNELSKQSQFEYQVVQGYVKLKYLMIQNGVEYKTAHSIFLSYLRFTPKGMMGYQKAKQGGFTKIQCPICRGSDVACFSLDQLQDCSK